MNMLNEVKILFNNIKNFRHLITEAVSDNDIIKYIQNHEYVYINYAGDGEHKKGYRTIRPYVLGTTKNGNKVLRAWQDNKKNSYSFDNRPTRDDSENHDYWNDENGFVPGWRMFSLDKITSIYPTGKRFNKSDGTVMIPTGYHEGGDDNMSSIIAYVSTKTEPDFEPNDVIPTTDEKKTKWTNFTRGNKSNRKITASDVVKLRDIASRIFKKSRGSFLVAINNNNDFELIDVRDRQKVPDSAIVGNLPNLYDTLVKQNQPEDNFFKVARQKAKTQREAEKNNIREAEMPTIPFEKKTFFK